MLCKPERRARVTATLLPVLVLWLLRAAPATALELALPIDCEVGQDCWLVNVVDLDPGRGVLDHACTSFTYDGHKGTDIAIRDLKAMDAGVSVLSSAPGTVRAVRDGMDDIDFTERGKDSVRGRECGNGVVIDHGRGWLTQYCHMKKGSILVKQGVTVTMGQRLGLVGHSGLAQFPHVHLEVRHNNEVIDPFVGSGPGTTCGSRKGSIWRKEAGQQLGDMPTAIFNAGFAAIRPQTVAVRAGLYHDGVLSRQVPALVLWADIYWPLAGDELRMRIFGPDGAVVYEHANPVVKTQARKLFYAGRNRPALFWPAGRYRGEITLTSGAGSQTALMQKVERTVILR